MSLFVINRYESEEWKKETNESRDHLSELLAQIEKRKLEREALRAAEDSKVENVLETSEISDNNSERKSKKHKKSKPSKSDSTASEVTGHNEENFEQHNFENVKDQSEIRLLDDEISEDKIKKYKKSKKRKLDSLISEEVIDNEQITEERNFESQKDSSEKSVVGNELLEKKSKRQKKKLKLNSSVNKVTTDKNNVIEENNVKAKKQLSKISQENFTILGHKKKLKNQVAKRVLPYWLQHPEIISTDLKSGPTFDELEKFLDSKLVKKLEEDGFKKLFPVQFDLLTWILKCDNDYKAGKWVRDTCVCMPTGSGKTLAYVLPIVQLLQKNFVRMVRCLIVLPVQELASQICEVIIKYASCVSLKVALLSGASSFKEEQEIIVQKNEKGDYISLVDIIIATPGRLVDHIRKTDGFSLSNLRFLVIDEADRATEWLQYIPFPHSKPPPLTIEAIRSSSNKPAQKILLSATLSQDPEKLNRLGLFRPILFTSVVIDYDNEKDVNLDEQCTNITNRYGNPSELTEEILQCAPQYKPLALYQLLVKDEVIKKTLVFTNSSEAAHRLAILLQSLLKTKNVCVGELSAQLGSKQREETLEKYIQGTIRVLVSSDALARGLDIPEVKLVVSYDLPKYVKVYIHRAGRTGRGGIPGTAVSILLPNQVDFFNKMLRKVGRSIPITDEENLDDIAESVNYELHLENLKNTLNEQQKSIRRSKSHKNTNRK